MIFYLWKGAGVAIEDAMHLCHALQNNTNKSIHETLLEYESSRATRIRNLHHISNLAQYIGHIDNNVRIFIYF